MGKNGLGQVVFAADYVRWLISVLALTNLLQIRIWAVFWDEFGKY